MLPTSSFAALLLVALIPGYLYLRLTEDARRPRDHTALGEFLEVLSVGVATTGIALGALILLRPRCIAETLKQVSIDDPDDLRRAVLVLALISAIALGIAWLGAWLTRTVGRDSYAPNVWRATLGLRRKQHVPYVVLELRDRDLRVEGVLHSYTTLDGDSPRDVALTKPKLSRGGSVWDAGSDYVVISADEIKMIWFKLTYDPGADA